MVYIYQIPKLFLNKWRSNVTRPIWLVLNKILQQDRNCLLTIPKTVTPSDSDRKLIGATVPYQGGQRRVKEDEDGSKRMKKSR